MSTSQIDKKKAYKKALKSALRKQELERKAELQVTSLMDIFVNVLIYLMMNYSTSPIDIQQSAERKLPSSDTQLEIAHTTTVGITRSAILVNRKKVCDLVDRRVDPQDKKDKRSSEYMIVPLYKSLKEEATKRKKLAKYNKSIKFDGKLTIVADEGMHFRLLSEIMYTAGQAEFGKFRFAVIKNKGG